MGRGHFLYAAKAVRREILGFSFDYPLEAAEEAAQRNSLSYYVISSSLFLDDLVFDHNGVPQKRYRAQGLQYNPLFIAWWGLHSLQHYVANGDHVHISRFQSQINWLENHVTTREDGAALWPCHFDWQEGRALLKAPWISAMYQGVIISALVRAYRLSGNKDFLELGMRACKVFSQDVEQGGVRSFEDGCPLYEEYPVRPLPRILDGFLFSLLGLYDLFVETEAAHIRKLFDEGVAGLKATLPFWDYRGKWTWYGSHRYLCPPHYHKLNWTLLRVLGRLTGDAVLLRTARQWDPSRHTLMDRTEIFAMFVATKNLARLRLPRN